MKSGPATEAAPKARAGHDRPIASEAPIETCEAMSGRLGNRGMQACFASARERRPTESVAANRSYRSSIEPSDASAQRRSMSHAFGVSFDDVRIRVDDAAAERAARAGVAAYTEGREIGFARDAYAPLTEAGRQTIAHEFAHVAQRRGGNTRERWPLMAANSMAEWQAQHAALAVLAGRRPRVSTFAQGGALYDSGKPAAAQLFAAKEEELLATVLRMLDDVAAGDQRRGAIAFLVGLAMQAGPTQQKATERLYNLLAGIPTRNLDDHRDAINELLQWVGRNVRAYDLLLYGRAWFADHSLAEIGSGLPLGAFRKYLHYDGGKWAVQFFKSRINGTDAFVARLAARMVADLLEGQTEPAEQQYGANYAALRTMARENGWDSFGPLAVAAATPRIFSALDASRQQARKLRSMIIMGPLGDERWEAEVERLDQFAAGLDIRGSRSVRTSTGATELMYSAENREETEHALLMLPTAEQVPITQEMAHAYTIAVDAGAKLQKRLEILHANALALEEFLGKDGARKSDEFLALFDLRKECIDTWLSVFDVTFSASSGGLAAGYRARIDLLDDHFDHFDKVVAQRKFRAARDRYQAYFKSWTEGDNRYPGNNTLNEEFFFAMRRLLRRESDQLTSRFAAGFATTMGGQVVTYQSTTGFATTDLRESARLAQDVNVFGLQSAVFLLYATNLSIHDVMMKGEVGSKSFRETQGNRLVSMRGELAVFWNQGDYGAFLKKAEGYEGTLKDVVEHIKDRAKLDALLNLAITLIATLVTEGAALAVRLASVSEVVAIARTARAIGSLNTLVDVGVFTAAELTLQKVFFGKDITVTGALKSAGTNLLFIGALKGVEKLAEPLAQGSRLRRLIMAHVAGFSGVAGVSVMMERIETGGWPPDIATFFGRSAMNYLLIAGMHHAFRTLVAGPKLADASAQRWERLLADNEALKDRLHGHVERGTLNAAEFENIRSERVRILEEVRALHQVMKDGGLISSAELDAVNQKMNDELGRVRSFKFSVPGAAGGSTTLEALPSPDATVELVRAGDSNVYVYQAAKSGKAVTTLLDRYREKGYTVVGNEALTRVLDPSGRTRFLLRAAPIETARLLLPADSNHPAVVPGDVLSRATGLEGLALDKARSSLRRINGDAEIKLPLGYPDHTVLATLALVVEQSSVVQSDWRIDAIRGIADSLSLERGIPRSAVRRLFKTIDPKALPELFENFHNIVASPKVGSGSRFLIADDLLPRNSVLLIDSWRLMMSKGIELPADMDLRAVRGVLRQIDRMPGRWLQWLSAIPKEQRGMKSRAMSALVDPTVSLPETVTQLLASITGDIPGYAGLNPLVGSNGDAFVKAVEARSPLARFAEPILRAAYVGKVDALRMDVALLQQGSLLEHGRWENIVGRANEVRQTASLLMSGATVLGSDRDVGVKGPVPAVDMANFPLPGGSKVVGAPAERNVHMDLLYNDASGTLNMLEMTTGELTLPTECIALDPKNAAYGSDIDWPALYAKRESATHRKFMQAIKIYQLNKMATAIGAAFAFGQEIKPAATTFQAGDFSVPAARALENMGFHLQLNDGTPQTAALIAARKATRGGAP